MIRFFWLSDSLKHGKLRFFVLLTAVSLLFLLPASAETDVYKNLFDNPEVNALIDANHEEVVKNGWAELRIPESVHQIPVEFIDPHAMEAAQVLLDAGYDVCIIGGAVRDLVLNEKSMDFDLTTNATIEEQIALFGDQLTFHPAGKYQFGYLHYPDEIVDLATSVNIPAFLAGMPGVPEFDTEALYSDNFLFDSFERDMTINAIYYDVATHELVTYHGGLYDIREKYLDTIADSDTVYRNDPNAAIRALRFHARFGYRFSGRVEDALRANAADYALLNAPGAMRANMPRFFTAGYAVKSLDVLDEYGVFDKVYFPIAELYQTDEYMAYLRTSFAWMDEWYASGYLLENELPMAVILWPAVVQETDGLSLAERAAAVFEAQQKTILLYDDDIQKLIDIYELSEKMAGAAEDKEAAEIMQAPQFENAYELLMIRACSDDSLADAAAFWTEKRDAALPDHDGVEEELAPAA